MNEILDAAITHYYIMLSSLNTLKAYAPESAISEMASSCLTATHALETILGNIYEAHGIPEPTKIVH